MGESGARGRAKRTVLGLKVGTVEVEEGVERVDMAVVGFVVAFVIVVIFGAVDGDGVEGSRYSVVGIQFPLPYEHTFSCSARLPVECRHCAIAFSVIQSVQTDETGCMHSTLLLLSPVLSSPIFSRYTRSVIVAHTRNSAQRQQCRSPQLRTLTSPQLPYLT